MEVIYIISTLDKAKDNEFKLGSHTGSPKKLLNRYATPLINPILYFFLPVTESKFIESAIKNILIKFRIKNNDGRITEWIKLDLFSIINIINIVVVFNSVNLLDQINIDENKQSVNVAQKTNVKSDEIALSCKIKFKCDRCHFKTNNKRDFDYHLNRKIPCTSNNQHGLAKINKKTNCKLCNRHFASEQSLNRHNKTFHTEIIN
jgi:hypothetical protein